MNNIKYFYSKIIRKMHPSSLRNCKIGKKSKVGYYSNLINVTIANYTYLGDHNSFCNVQIGSFCSIASYCSIGGGNHDYSRVSTSPIFEEGKNVFRLNLGKMSKPKQEKVFIGNDVWIGENVFIKPGINIGDGAVIGAHSVVTKNVPPYAIVAGCPAKVIKYRFDEQTIKKLEEIKWWEMDEKYLKNVSSHFDDIDYFLRENNKNGNKK